MFLYDSQIWLEDLDMVIDHNPEIRSLSGMKIFITGIGGLICSAVADILIRLNERENAGITILAAARSEQKLRKRFGIYFDKPYFHFIPYDALKPDINTDEACDYIIHGAGNAYPAIFTKEPVETMVENFNGILNLLRYGKSHGTKRVLYISSSEIYGRKDGNEPYREDEYGYIDVLNARNCYAISKRSAETLCVSYAAEYGVESVIVRPGHIYGPTASPYDNRVSSAWAYAAARGEDILMKSDGSQLRSYCYCLDCASAILIALINGQSGTAYNIANPESLISIREMAEIISEFGNINLRFEKPTDLEEKKFNPMNNSSLDSSKLSYIGWKGCFPSEQGINHTVEILKCSFEVE